MRDGYRLWEDSGVRGPFPDCLRTRILTYHTAGPF